MPREWDDALNTAQGLLDRCDAFEKRRSERRADKERRRAARRDGDDPSSSPETRQNEAPPDFREDYAPEERNELRQGALSKAEE
jgi:hypothetical protein